MGRHELRKVMSERVKIIRECRNISRTELSRKINKDPFFIRDFEDGKRIVSAATLRKLCEALNTSADYLLGLSYATIVPRNVSEFQDLATRLWAQDFEEVLRIMREMKEKRKRNPREGEFQEG